MTKLMQVFAGRNHIIITTYEQNSINYQQIRQKIENMVHTYTFAKMCP